MMPFSLGDNAAPLALISLPETLIAPGTSSCAPAPFGGGALRLSVASPTHGADRAPLQADHYDFALALAATFICIAAASARRRRWWR